MNIKCIFTQVNRLYKLNYSSLFFIYSFLSIKNTYRDKSILNNLMICIGKQSVKIERLNALICLIVFYSVNLRIEICGCLVVLKTNGYMRDSYPEF